MVKQSFIYGAVLTFLGCILHIAIIIGGPEWYLASGAGENMAKLAETGSIYPAFIGVILVCIFFGWSLYALSGAGVIRRLPFLKECLILISALCMVRGLYGFFVPFLFDSPYVASLGVWFWVYSSTIWLVIGLFYAAGLASRWSYISDKKQSRKLKKDRQVEQCAQLD
ncbi:hypothetical protein [Psychrosphaera algicola]|uniref:DUF3995 domain-containing protein n=1 Tax=Psychrosphaera algicola TaxID=3023714 RepID=A0ABT5FEG6_9GAMM|nr:hypothetical protein [Psychrosphaera sp. G1-22]MDC2889721.1 hypothetical protein [Psychrosphaera sp. G1-22]